MNFGLYLPTQGPFADVRLLASLAHDADRSGWDGLFIWDELLSIGDSWPFAATWKTAADTTVALAAIALATERLRFGPLVTPLPRRRPAKFARETATLDRLSGGRLTLGVGIGNPDDQFARFGEEATTRARAAKLDEFLELLVTLWSGDRVRFQGTHYAAQDVELQPSPMQQPRIPIWIGADHARRAPLRRAARWDGFAPASPDWPDQVIGAEEYRRALTYIASLRSEDRPYDVAFMTNGRGDIPPPTRENVSEYANVGVTWWLVQAHDLERARQLVTAGRPPD